MRIDERGMVTSSSMWPNDGDYRIEFNWMDDDKDLLFSSNFLGKEDVFFTKNVEALN